MSRAWTYTLIDSAGVRIPISARVEERNYGEAGRHRFDYEGGIDLGVDPPPDGTYQVCGAGTGCCRTAHATGDQT